MSKLLKPKELSELTRVSSFRTLCNPKPVHCKSPSKNPNFEGHDAAMEIFTILTPNSATLRKPSHSDSPDRRENHLPVIVEDEDCFEIGAEIGLLRTSPSISTHVHQM
jgi:hypothetical protein